MTVRQLLASMDSQEISEWIAFFNLQTAQSHKEDLDSQFKTALRSRKKK